MWHVGHICCSCRPAHAQAGCVGMVGASASVASVGKRPQRLPNAHNGPACSLRPLAPAASSISPDLLSPSASEPPCTSASGSGVLS